MINVIKGDLLNAQQGVIIHGCNAQGVMGSGVAAGVKTRFPRAYQVYAEHYNTNGLYVGTCIPVAIKPDLWIINAITQNLYAKKGAAPGVFVDYDAIRLCFDWVDYFMTQLDDALDLTPANGLELHMPKIGAGRAGGDWNAIQSIIEATMTPTRKVNLYVVDAEPTDCR